MHVTHVETTGHFVSISPFTSAIILHYTTTTRISPTSSSSTSISTALPPTTRRLILCHPPRPQCAIILPCDDLFRELNHAPATLWHNLALRRCLSSPDLHTVRRPHLGPRALSARSACHVCLPCDPCAWTCSRYLPARPRNLIIFTRRTPRMKTHNGSSPSIKAPPPPPLPHATHRA